MLLAMHQLYPGAGILNDMDVIVVDEAHKFADYMRNAVGTEFGLNSIEKRLRLAEKYEVDTDDADRFKRAFFRAITERVGDNLERQIGVDHHDILGDGQKLAGEMMLVADEIWSLEDMPSAPDERKRKVDADQIRNLADALSFFSRETQAGFVRWIEQDNGALSCRHVPHDVSEHVSRMAGFQESEAIVLDHTHCARCGRKLTADAVAILEGLPYGPDCIRHVDIMGDAEHLPLAEWLARATAPAVATHERTPIIFCSATLAAPDMAAFLRECGLPWALQMVAASPFDYESNALLYVPAAIAPAPGKGDYDAWLTEEVERLVEASEGGAFLLFTSYKSMRQVEQRLHWGFERKGWPVFVQGSMPKLEIVKRFAEAGNGVLFATKSFWEGVSIDGRSLRLVIIDKMPFEAPSPLNTAQEAALRLWAREQGMAERQIEWYPFEALRVPKMIIDLKQGSGRLIRTGTDWGCIAILDSRLRAAQYARRLVLPALPPAKLTCKIHEVDAFFQDRLHAAPALPLKALTPVEQVVEIGSVINNEVIPF
jgi:Rad3-related DNA helicase